jgi:putative phage-type endonuclease
MKFTPPIIGTTTLTSCIYDTIGAVDIEKLAETLDVDVDQKSKNHVFYIECYVKKVTGYKSVIKGAKHKKAKKYDPSKDKVKNRPGFSNSMTIDFGIWNGTNKYNDISVKITTNGNIECAGLKSKAQIDTLQLELISRLSALPGEIFNAKLVIAPYKINMITYSFRAMDDNDYPLKIDNYKLYNYVKAEISGIQCSYETLENAYLCLFNSGVIYYIFQSAKINVTALKSFADIQNSYEFIKKFICDNINNFIMNDYISSVLKKIKSTPFYKQKSIEWLEQRVSKITATELSVVVGVNSFNSIDDLIMQKKNILEGIAPKSCPAMVHGNIFEPLAKKIYETTENAKCKRHITVFEDLTLMTHDKYPFLGASLDSIVFVTKKPSAGATLDELIALYDKGEIYDAYDLEIKCPLTYHEYPDNDIFEPYRVQVQLQLDVTGLKYAVLLINKFDRFNTYDEFKNDTTAADFYGVVMEIENEQYIYPTKKISYSADLSDMLSEFNDKKLNGKLIYWKFIRSRQYELDNCKTWLDDNIKNITSHHEYIQEKVKDKTYTGAYELEL